MDPWKFIAEGKNLLLPEEMDVTADGVGRSRNKVLGLEIKALSQPDSYHPLISNTEAFETLGVVGLGFPDIGRKPYSRDPSGDGLSDELGADSYENLASPACTTSNVAWGEGEFVQRASGYFVESNSEESPPPIDLKLGWLADSRAVKDAGGSPQDGKAVSSVVSSLPAKRARSSSLCLQTPFCQVYGCNKDLSSSKDYHKRHRVCDAHSKTAKVIVNGIEQRFCQQCSRFHLLAEFDDGKRSCRKRLANHNERRRKPQLAIQPGARFLDSSVLKRASFLFPNALPGGLLSPSKHEPGKWTRQIKFEDSSTISNNSLGMNSVGERVGISRDNVMSILAPGVQAVANATNSSCALSLLSNQPLNTSSNMLGSTFGRQQMTRSSDTDYCHRQSLGFSLGCIENLGANLLYSPDQGSSLKVIDRLGTAMVCSDDQLVNLKVPASGSLVTSDFANPRCCVSSGNSSMVDLLQLSSHLERVQHQRSSVQPMSQNDVFCGFSHSHGG